MGGSFGFIWGSLTGTMTRSAHPLILFRVGHVSAFGHGLAVVCRVAGRGFRNLIR
jgi:hypothetical protein